MKTIVATILSMTVAANAADWPQFLGPQRDGSAAATEKAISGESEAETLWKRDLGSGFAGPVVVDGHVIVFHRVDDEMVTESLQTTDGSVTWKHSYTTDYVDGFGFDNGPRAVPAVVDGQVFTHGPEGRVEALNLAKGELKAKATIIVTGASAAAIEAVAKAGGSLTVAAPAAAAAE